jgi:hypothetical protein
MKFHLQFPVRESETKLNYRDPVLLMGSCFAESIGSRLQNAGFDTDINPNGILYNPVSLASALESYYNGQAATEKDIVRIKDVWYSSQHHGEFASADPEQLLEKINQRRKLVHERIGSITWLCLTLGSAFAFRTKDGEVVANCHKQPADLFEKILISHEQSYDSLKSAIAFFRSKNPALKVLLTVSPVRYVRDGVVENNLSKAILLQTVHRLCAEQNDCHYFPAYELLIDDLRDYRFYKSDLVHPTEQAVDYIFEKLRSSWLDEESKKIYDIVYAYNAAAAHRPLRPESAEAKAFAEQLQKRKTDILKEYPFLKL